VNFKTIDRTQIVFLQKRRRDDIGEVFLWDGKILRGIFPDATDLVKGFFESGFVDHLVKEELFPESWITEYECDGYGLIVEHEKIWPIIYPQEWSFSMLQDAALVILKVARIAREHGYNMKDCHGFNVLFDENKPKFIDLGSFHKITYGSKGWEPYQEFLRFYYYPLFMWKDGLEYVAKLSIFSANLMPHSEHLIYKYRFLRFLSSGILDKIIKFKFAFSHLASKDYVYIQNKTSNKNTFIRNSIKLGKRIINITGFMASQDLGKFERKIKNIKRKNTMTQWKDYHTGISRKKDRFDKIIEYVNCHCQDAKTAIDIAGNQGLFSKLLLSHTDIEKVICQDLDEQAIDIGYKNHRKNSENISYVNYHSIAPIVKTTHPLPSERFKCDIVFTLALLHHLILSQGFSIEDIFEEFGRYTNKYVCIEFMPKGLWVQGAEVKIPPWYTEEWFRERFKRYFEILKKEQIAENYIVYIGKLKEKACNG